MVGERGMAAIGAALIAVAASACAGDGRNEPAGPEERAAGAAAQALVPAYCILNAHTDNGTVHFQGPDWLLSSSEGLGPQQLSVRVSQYVQPAVSTTGNFTLDATGVSNAVGYNMAERYEIIGGARLDVATFAFQRLEAYTAYQRTIWEIRDGACEAILGYGASFRPIGVYFRTVNTSDTWIPDLGVTLVGPVAVDPSALVPAGPGAVLPPGGSGGAAGPSDAGAGDAGAGDAGPSDAGAADGG
jgi:hypothetical protein